MRKLNIHRQNCSVKQHKQQIMPQSTNEPPLRYNNAGIQEETINTEVATKNSEAVILQPLKLVLEPREVKHN